MASSRIFGSSGAVGTIGCLFRPTSSDDAMTSLSAAATQIAAELGPPFTARSRYAYTVPSDGGAAVRVLDAAIFSSPSPSLNSAYLAISQVAPDREQQLTELGYFGAPFAL